MTKPTPKGLTRIEIPAKRTFGYMVRLRRGGEMLANEFFADRKHGGKRAAKSAAAARYQELVAVAPPPKTAQKGILTSRNSSGQVGVRLAISIGRPSSDTEYFAWAAFWTDPDGRRRTVSFSWNKFGDDAAHRLATIARAREETDRRKVYRTYQRQTGKRITDGRLG